ncbi:MAG: hypothetical protein NTY19_04780 [Planctomycetota bacterium]|nr:hypothetical protein [Planctomycetota bacterium]
MQTYTLGSRTYTLARPGDHIDMWMHGQTWRAMTPAELAQVPSTTPASVRPVPVALPVASPDPVLDFSAAVQKRMGRAEGLPARQAAIRSVAKAKPELYAAALAAANPGKLAVAPVTSTADQTTLTDGWQACVAREIANGADPIRARFLARRRAPGLHAALLTVTGG